MVSVKQKLRFCQQLPRSTLCVFTCSQKLGSVCVKMTRQHCVRCWSTFTANPPALISQHSTTREQISYLLHRWCHGLNCQGIWRFNLPVDFLVPDVVYLVVLKYLFHVFTGNECTYLYFLCIKLFKLCCFSLLHCSLLLLCFIPHFPCTFAEILDPCS